MGTVWDNAYDDFDLETLLDGLDRPCVPNASSKQTLSNGFSKPASTAGPASTPRDPPASNPRHFPEQLQAKQKQATEDGERFADKENGETSPQTSVYNIGGRHDISHSVRDPDRNSHEETSNNQYRMASRSDGEEGISFKHRFRGDLQDVSHNLEETSDQNRQQDVRLSSGVGRDNRAAKGGCSGSSLDSRGRAGKRIQQDENGGTGWDNPICVDDFSQGRMGCKEGVPRDGRRSGQASPLSSSPEIPLAQEIAEVSHGRGMELSNPASDRPLERETSPPITVLGYKIPGPAGALQNCLTSTGHRAHGLRHAERHFGPGGPSHTPMAAADTLDFREGPWLAAMSFLNDGDPSIGNHLSRSTIFSINATTEQVPQLVAIINTVVRNGFGDLSVTLKDPTGIISGSIHRKVLTELEDGHLIAPGAVIIIRKVAVFSPTPFRHYLNITINNVDQIFGKDTIAPRRRNKAVNDRIDDSGIPRRDHPISEPGSKYLSQIQTAPIEGYQAEIIAPRSGNSEREGLTNLTHTLGNNDCTQSDCPNDTSPRRGKRARKSLPLPTILEDAVNLTKRAVTANVSLPNNVSSQFPGDDRASQEDIAKAAGWDFSEDIELLLADDFF